MTLWREVARRDRALAIGGLLMSVGLAAAAVAAAFDSREILGINPWIKPMKFLSSIAIFMWTMAWYMREADPRLSRRLSLIRWTILTTLFGEILLIAMQAARGTTSHFNTRSTFDAAVFQTMGVMIVCNTAAVAAFLTTLRVPEASRAGYLWGLRVGLVLFVLGSLQGFMMVGNMAHSVPGPDGGPGLPFVNWATDMGDLRVAHFLGLHALQALPLVGYLLDRRWAAPPVDRARMVTAATVLYVGFWSALLILALAGQPLVRGQGSVTVPAAPPTIE